jgi:hypothetical protein
MESITNNMAIVPAGHHNYREVALPLGAHLPNFWGYRAFEKSKLQPSFTQPSVDRNPEITIQPQFAYAINQLERMHCGPGTGTRKSRVHTATTRRSASTICRT